MHTDHILYIVLFGLFTETATPTENIRSTTEIVMWKFNNHIPKACSVSDDQLKSRGQKEKMRHKCLQIKFIIMTNWYTPMRVVSNFTNAHIL